MPECAMTHKIIKKHISAAVISSIVVGLAMPAGAAEPTVAPVPAGFYGGVSMRDHGTDTTGLRTGAAASAWTRFTAPTTDDASARALVFGGYRWGNDVALEASFSSTDKYALRPPDMAPARRGVGLGLGQGDGAPGAGDAAARSWNVDVYTSWAFYKTLSLYGRLGYAQAEAAPLLAGASAGGAADLRRLRDGVNYGVGLRYDIKSDLGLRVEYARFARFGIDTGNVLPESDQVSFGVQFRF